MAAKEHSSRAEYGVAVVEALRSYGGVARPPQVFKWLETNHSIRSEDRRELPSGGPRWEKEARFAVLALARGGLVDRSEYGIWRLTPAGQAVKFSPALSAALIDATDGRKLGGLTLERTYTAIRNAARANRFISYGALADANGVRWMNVRSVMPRILGRLVIIGHVRGWPMLSAVVVDKGSIVTGEMKEGPLAGFLTAAKSIGIEPDNPAEFVRDQQLRVFAWAKTAPPRLDAEGRSDAEASSEGALGGDLSQPPSQQERQYWIAGALWGGSEDQMSRFRSDGIWQSGDDEQAQLVAQMRMGDRIAIKAAFVRKHGLPFDAGGEHVSAMRIKATGTIVGNRHDGRTVDVLWDGPTPPRDWYFYTFRKTLARLDPENEHARRLIAFIFGGVDQDYDWWLSLEYFADKYGVRRDFEVPLPNESTRGQVAEVEEREEATTAGPIYTVDSILADGCFLNLAEIQEILDTLTVKRNLVLQGPPGTGKSWLAKRLAYALVGSAGIVARERVRVVQFHPSLSYEDFVRGWRPASDQKLDLVEGIFLDSIAAAQADPNPFVLVIEEINRGNPAQIFGELLTLIENTKRRPEEALELAYRRQKGERVYVPENLFIIGTMNIADRSLALVDLALRRRFAFVTLEPRFGSPWREWSRTKGGLSDEMLAMIELRLNDLNRRVSEDRSLGKQFRIGHSYVTPEGPVGDGPGWFRRRVQTEILPLLEEYWFDQPDKLEEARQALMADL